MDKIKYILALNNIRMTEAAKESINRGLRTASSDAWRRKRRKTVTAAVVSVLSVLLVTALIVVVVNSIRNQHGKDGPVTDAITAAPPPTTAPETDAPVAIPDEEYFTVRALYDNIPYYDVFRSAASCMIPTEDESAVVLASDLSAMYGYFGSEDTESICETLFAFYERGNSYVYYRIPEDLDPKSVEISEELGLASDSCDRNEIIVLSAKNGTFEYLLTFSVLEPKNWGSTYGSYTFFNSAGVILGEYSAGTGYRILKYNMNMIRANVYKIRNEKGVPVIYERTSVRFRTGMEENGGETVIRADNANVSFVKSTGVLKKGAFITDSHGYVLMSATENNPEEKIGPSGKSFEFPYSYPRGDETGAVSRKTVCDIINKFDLQWFFPCYICEKPIGTTIIGGGIKTPFLTEGTPVSSFIDSSSIHVEQRLFVDLSGTPLINSICYDPSVCDRPYFNLNLINNGGLSMVEIDPVNGTMNICPPLEDALYLREPEALESGFEFNYMYMADKKGVKGYPFSAYSADLLPFCGAYGHDSEKNGLTDALELKTFDFVQPISVSVNGDEPVELMDTLILTRKMHAISTDDVTAAFANKGDTKKYSYVTAYQTERSSVIDVNGEICGIMTGGGAYLFDTAAHQFTFLVIADSDGNLLYMGPETQYTQENTATEQNGYRFEKTQSGIFFGTLAHAAELCSGDFVLLSLKNDGPETFAEAVYMYAGRVSYPLRSGMKTITTYNNGKIEKTEWPYHTETNLLQLPEPSVLGEFVFFSENENAIIIGTPGKKYDVSPAAEDD